MKIKRGLGKLSSLFESAVVVLISSLFVISIVFAGICISHRYGYASKDMNIKENSYIKKTFTIGNKLGLHARPASLFVRTANKYECDFIVQKGI